MTAEDIWSAAQAHDRRRIIFVESVDPLPLLDPTLAASVLKVARHTMACYRHRGCGPSYYKIGRSVRYTMVDLNSWSGLQVGTTQDPLASLDGDDPDTVVMATSVEAARFLTVTRFCLRSYRLQGGGPRFRRLGRRAFYAIEDLRHWARCQRADQAPHSKM
jgi:hypothetical protein